LWLLAIEYIYSGCDSGLNISDSLAPRPSSLHSWICNVVVAVCSGVVSDPMEARVSERDVIVKWNVLHFRSRPDLHFTFSEERCHLIIYARLSQPGGCTVITYSYILYIIYYIVYIVY
jgi:hypothetical protein